MNLRNYYTYYFRLQISTATDNWHFATVQWLVSKSLAWPRYTC